MKTGYYANSGVRCPRYKRQNWSVICCKGPVDGTCFSISFDERNRRADWQKAFCGYGDNRGNIEGDYKECPVYRMMEGGE